VLIKLIPSILEGLVLLVGQVMQTLCTLRILSLPQQNHRHLEVSKSPQFASPISVSEFLLSCRGVTGRGRVSSEAMSTDINLTHPCTCKVLLVGILFVAVLFASH
jgi:hypothetical protein